MATTTAPHIPATEAQLSFIRDLLASRELTGIDADAIRETLPRMSKPVASLTIDKLTKLPRRSSSWKAAKAATSELQAALASIPKSKYAVPVEQLEFLELDAQGSIHGDLLFLEVREYMHTLYMRRMTGAPGAFTRHKLSSKDTLALIKLLARDPYEYTRLFGLHYSCCGKCGAELTDPLSRKLQLGPECRKAFGF